MAGAGQKPASPRSVEDTPAPTQRERRRQWARLIAKVFEVDPRRCRMSLVALTTAGSGRKSRYMPAS